MKMEILIHSHYVDLENFCMTSKEAVVVYSSLFFWRRKAIHDKLKIPPGLLEPETPYVKVAAENRKCIQGAEKYRPEYYGNHKIIDCINFYMRRKIPNAARYYVDVYDNLYKNLGPNEMKFNIGELKNRRVQIDEYK